MTRKTLLALLVLPAVALVGYTGMAFVPDPTHHPYLRCDWPGWTCDEEIGRLVDAIRRESDAHTAEGMP